MPGAYMKSLVPIEVIEGKILLIRGNKVMLDSDLADLYGVETRIESGCAPEQRTFSGRFHVYLDAG